MDASDIYRYLQHLFTANLVEHAAYDNIVKSMSHRLDDNCRHRLLGSAKSQRSIALGNKKHELVQNLTTLVESLVEREWASGDKAVEELRVQYAKNICDAIQTGQYGRLLFGGRTTRHRGPDSLQPVVVAAYAAVGNVQMFLNNVHTIEDIFKAGDKEFPSSLNAAVAANQTEMVNVIHEWLLATVRGPWETGDWEEMRYVARGLARALRVAIRMFRDIIGHMILQTLSREKNLAKSVFQPLIRDA